jgi:predicted RNA-binding protein
MMSLRIPDKVWIVSVTKDNYDVCVRKGIISMRFCSLARKVNVGDGIIFYIKGEMGLRNLWRVRSEWIVQDEPLWPDEVMFRTAIYKYRVEIEPLMRSAVKVEELVNGLSFIKFKNKWSIYLAGGLANLGRPIPRSDAEVIISRMRMSEV